MNSGSTRKKMVVGPTCPSLLPVAYVAICVQEPLIALLPESMTCASVDNEFLDALHPVATWMMSAMRC